MKQNNDGILYLFKKNKVAFFHGRGSFAKAGDGGYEIAVAGASRRDARRQARHRGHRLERRARCRARRSTRSASCPTTARCASAACRRRWA